MSQIENFEASFDEQLRVIQSEKLARGEIDLTNLPAQMHEKQNDKYYCFPWPDGEVPAETPAQILNDLTWDPQSRTRAATIMTDYCDTNALEMSLLSGLDSETQEAAARILAILVCAEESAINIFHHEVKRVVDEDLVAANKQALEEIESEERVHNWLIHKARNFYPVPDDIHSIRRRTRRLFMRVGSRDMGTHFARISGLDSGVCICLTALLGFSKVNGIEGFARLIRHIRRDEATHVKKSRQHAVHLGFDANQFHEAYELTREGMVGMLEPISSSFETMEVDPDRLYQRLLRFSTKN